MKFRLVPAAAALTFGVLALPASPAFAATATGTFPVTATVVNTCTVSSTGVAFGNYTGTLVTNTGNNIALACNKGVPIVSLTIGDGAHASGVQKRMVHSVTATEFLNYNIDLPVAPALTTCPGANTAPWTGTNTPLAANLTALFTAGGGTKNIPICASIPAGQLPIGGLYSDTITMTLTYN